MVNVRVTSGRRSSHHAWVADATGATAADLAMHGGESFGACGTERGDSSDASNSFAMDGTLAPSTAARSWRRELKARQPRTSPDVGSGWASGSAITARYPGVDGTKRGGSAAVVAGFASRRFAILVYSEGELVAKRAESRSEPVDDPCQRCVMRCTGRRAWSTPR